MRLILGTKLRNIPGKLTVPRLRRTCHLYISRFTMAPNRSVARKIAAIFRNDQLKQCFDSSSKHFLVR